MNIAIDIDEVLADFIKEFILFFNEKYGVSLSRDNVKSFDLEKDLQISFDERIKMYSEFFESDYFKKVKPVYGAVEAIKLLSKKHNLSVITLRNRSAREATLEWIREHFQDYFNLDKIYFSQNKCNDGLRKWEIALNEKIDLAIEDATHIINDYSLKGIPTIIMDAPWNKECNPNLTFRAKNWTDILVLIEKFESGEIVLKN